MSSSRTVPRWRLTLRSIAAPLFAITGKLAAAVPALRDPAFAKAVAQVIITALLRAYQAGARAARRAGLERGGIDPQALAAAAERSREQARARDHSARLLLEHIHTACAIDIPLDRFRREGRRFPLEVLRDAERAFAHRLERGRFRLPLLVGDTVRLDAGQLAMLLDGVDLAHVRRNPALASTGGEPEAMIAIPRAHRMQTLHGRPTPTTPGRALPNTATVASRLHLSATRG